MGWLFKEGIPIYSQIVEHIKNCIARGELSSGDKVPSVREFALDAGVNPNTMQRALSELEHEGILFSERTSGRFVTGDEGVLAEMKRKLGDRYICEMFDNLEGIGLTDDEIREAVSCWRRP